MLEHLNQGQDPLLSTSHAGPTGLLRVWKKKPQTSSCVQPLLYFFCFKCPEQTSKDRPRVSGHVLFTGLGTTLPLSIHLIKPEALPREQDFFFPGEGPGLSQKQKNSAFLYLLVAFFK